MISESSKSHLQNKSNYDVKQLVISNTNTDYLPDGLGILFSLTSLMVYATSLQEISHKNFAGMDDLEYLYLAQNQLTFLPKDSFLNLKKLKKINLSQNQLEVLEKNLFINNLRLDYIWLQSNKVNYIENDLFQHLNKLNYVDLRNNKCVNKIYSDIVEIYELKNDKESCKNPNGKQKICEQTINQKNIDLKIEMESTKTKYENEKVERLLIEDQLNIEIATLKEDQKIDADKLIELNYNITKLNSDISSMEMNHKLDVNELKKDKSQLQNTISTCNKEKVDLNKNISKLNLVVSSMEINYKVKADTLAEVKTQLENAQNLSIEGMKGLQSTINIIKNDKLSLQHQIEGCQTEFENYKLKKKPDSDISTLQSMNTQLDGQNLELQNQINDLNAQISLSNKKHNYLTCEYSIHWSDYTCNGKGLQIYNDKSEIYMVIGKQSFWNKNSDVDRLKMENSEMFYVPNNLFKIFNNLKTVYFQTVNLQYLIRGNFNGASKLTNLFINKNQIKSLDDNIFDGANNLELLDMSSNKIEKLSSKTFENLLQLKQLSLMNNSFKELDVQVFRNLINLEVLDLSSNKLKSVDGKLLKFNKKLVEISFSSNELEEIGENILNYSKGLNHFDFTGNKCFKINAWSNKFKINIIQEFKKNCKKNMIMK
ncbi:unnamed protein product [Diamesa tonsa]